jgi:hypothetical protein
VYNSAERRLYLVDLTKRSGVEDGEIDRADGIAESSQNRTRRAMPSFLRLRWYVNLRYWRQFSAALCIYSVSFAFWKLAVR